MRDYIFAIALLFATGVAMAQESTPTQSMSEYIWHNCDNIASRSESTVRFSSNSPSIAIRYTLESRGEEPAITLSMSNNEGQVKSLKGESVSSQDGEIFQFAEGINYSSAALRRGGYEFCIYLPPLAKIERLEVGTKGDSFLGFSLLREEKPIMVLNLQKGAEPLTTTLARNLDRAVCEVATFDEASKIDAKAFVVRGSTKRITKGLRTLRQEHETTPIIVDNQEVISRLKRSGAENIYSVEGQSTYEQRLREVLNCRVGDISTTIPTSQRRVPSHMWSNQCQYIIKDIKTSPAKCAIIGNSIVHNWGGNPDYKQRLTDVAGQESWMRYMSDYVNMGIGSDRIENLLLRIYNDQMEIRDFEKIIVMAGTNNLNVSSTEDIAAGVENLIEQIKIRQKSAQIFLLGILPRKDIEWSKIQKINSEYEKIAKEQGVEYLDLGELLIDENGTPRNEFFKDNVHPSAMGYEVIGRVLGEL